ncbi:MAG: branched-chain amino acid ABC transporter substrate-binding protein [Haloechinothrix sp.]
MRARTRIVPALLAACALLLGACDDGDENNDPLRSVGADIADPRGDGTARCRDVVIAYAGPSFGEDAGLGRNVLSGVRLAIHRHNQANAGCQVELEEFETDGVPEKARGLVSNIVGSREVIGVVGLVYSGEMEATGGIFADAGLVQITPSATLPTLSSHGWDTFFRGTGHDGAQAAAAARFLTEHLDARKVCVIGDESAYGANLAKAVRAELGDAGQCAGTVKSHQRDFSDLVDEIKSEDPDAVYYAGYYREAGPFARQLAEAAVTVPFVGSDGVMDAEFLEDAGGPPGRVYFTCPCTPPGLHPGFVDAFRQAFGGREPGAYAAEGYDAATALLRGIDAGNVDRASLLEFIDGYRGRGLTAQMEWNSQGELAKPTIWTYRVKQGEIVRHVKIS